MNHFMNQKWKEKPYCENLLKKPSKLKVRSREKLKELEVSPYRKWNLTSLLSWCSFKVPPCSAWFSILLINRDRVSEKFLDCSLQTYTRPSNQRNSTNPFENHSLNCSWLSNNIGMMKCNRAHNSAMLFWIGVPVRSNRFRQLKLRRVFHLILSKKKGKWNLHEKLAFQKRTRMTIMHWKFNVQQDKNN